MSGKSQRPAVVGGGPAGLMAAMMLAEAGLRVDLFEAMPSFGRKLLIAGRGGFNLTHSAPLPEFVTRYGINQSWFAEIFSHFSPDDFRSWLRELGIETYVGTSGRVFPIEKNAADLLRTLLKRLERAGVTFHTRHRLIDIPPDGTLLFRRSDGSEHSVTPAGSILALGGASWPKTGSDGAWTTILARRGVTIVPFAPSNCGFETVWSGKFVERFAGTPLKNLRLSTGQGHQQVGELVITRYGIEGGAIYPLCPPLRREIAAHGRAVVFLDLKKDLDEKTVRARLSRRHGKESLSNFLRKQLHLDGPIYSLLRECCPLEDFHDPSRLAATIKHLPLTLTAIRPLAEAISSAGGIAMDEVDETCMLHKLPGVFVAGEMLDWEAPTGGFLLQAAFSTGYRAGLGLLTFLDQQHFQ